MSSYAAILSANFRTLLQYRSAAIAGLVTQIFWGLIRVMIFEAFYRSTTTEQPMTLNEVITIRLAWAGIHHAPALEHRPPDPLSHPLRPWSATSCCAPWISTTYG